MSVNANVETDLFTRLANLEAACFAAGLNNGTASPVFQGTVQTPPVVYSAAADQIAYPGTAILARSGNVDAALLATPTPGTDDGKLLRVFNGAAQLNTVTTASGKILDGTGTPKDQLQFAAQLGGCCTLQAYGGYWYVVDTPLHCTLAAA
jgi:hypothetical protein